jgi:hypothetical protein
MDARALKRWDDGRREMEKRSPKLGVRNGLLY